MNHLPDVPQNLEPAIPEQPAAPPQPTPVRPLGGLAAQRALEQPAADEPTRRLIARPLQAAAEASTPPGELPAGSSVSDPQPEPRLRIPKLNWQASTPVPPTRVFKLEMSLFEYEAAINAALENAPQLQASAATDLPGETINEPMHDYSVLVPEPDDVSISLNFEEAPPAPNEIRVATLSEVAQVYKEFLAITGHTAQQFTDMAAEHVQHESEHDLAAERLGAGGRHYSLVVARAANGNFTWQASHTAQRLVTSKLGFAALTVHPQEPSAGDKHSAQTMGYEGVDEIGARIQAHNDQGGKYIPPPLSWRPSGKRHIV